LAFLYWRGVVETWQIYVILSLRALGTAFHDPAMMASTSLMVPRDQLTRVAGMNQVRKAVTQIGGVPLGALLVAWLPIQAILAIDVVTALLAIVPLLFIDVPQPDPAVTRGRGWRAAIRETGEGARYLWSWRGLLVVCTTFSLVPFFNRPANALRPLLIKAHFGGGPVEWGWAGMAAAAGSLAGGLLMSTWGGFKRRFLTMLTGLTVFGLVRLVQGLAPAHALWLFVAGMLLSGPAAAMGFAALRAIMQSTVPPEMQGRVFSLRISLFGAMTPLGLAVLGPLADAIGIRAIYLLDGAACLLVALLWSVTRSVRNLEEGPLEQGERIERLSFGR
jgi:DHA3 family macrolide efflux protein-like MFS transporter